MNGKLSTLAPLAAVAGACVVAVAILVAVAQAAGGGGGSATTPQPARAVTASVNAAPLAVASAAACRPRGRAKQPGSGAATATPPSEALKNAFGILRRDREDDDALPARALAALKAAGFGTIDADAARLLRADRAARAWVVPVPDVNAANRFVACVRATAAAKPQEGLAVVSLGGAPAGGGGALRALQRGTATAAIDPCAGAGRNMLGVSGIVPDGVEAVFVTGADGTATRADVHDNGYVFVLPRVKRPESRFVVWTGSDGNPHVQPLPVPPAFLRGPGGACPRVPAQALVTPSPGALDCSPLAGVMAQINGHAVALTSIPRARARLRRGGRAARRVPPPLPMIAPAVPIDPRTGALCAPSATPLLYAPTPIVTAPGPRRPGARGGPPVPVVIAPGARVTRPRDVPPATAVVPPAPRAAPAPASAPRVPRRAPAPTVTVAPAPAQSVTTP